MTNSRISGFYNLTLEERRAKLVDASHVEARLPKTCPVYYGRTFP